MTYVKPEVVLTANAAEVIRLSTNKPVNVFQEDANQIQYNATTTAYDADE